MRTGPLRLATRRSPLALAQATQTARRITEITGRDVELVPITTQGDTDLAPLSRIGGDGVFAVGVRLAVREGEADLAVHSLKDLPTARAEGLVIAAHPEREDPRDVMCGALLHELPRGAKIGTGSPRRIAQLKLSRPDVECVDIRGNVETRLARIGELDAVVLAAAGLSRLGMTDRISQRLSPDVMLPAPGQGALAVEVREDHEELLEALGALDDAATRAAVTAERTLLAVLEAGCSAPVGALATTGRQGLSGSALVLNAIVASHDGTRHVRLSAQGDPRAAAELGRELAEQLLTRGAADLMGDTL